MLRRKRLVQAHTKKIVTFVRSNSVIFAIFLGTEKGSSIPFGVLADGKLCGYFSTLQ